MSTRSKLASKLAIVNLAEADSALRRATVTAAWRGLKHEVERAATPQRILVAGLATGFVSGLRGSGGSGSPLGGKVFGMLIESAFASFTAAMAAGAAAAAPSSSPDASNHEADPSASTARGTP